MVFRPRQCYSVEAGEFLCPLCGCFSNAVLPALPPSVETIITKDSTKEILKRKDCFQLLRQAASEHCQVMMSSCIRNTAVQVACCVAADHVLVPITDGAYEWSDLI